MSRERQNTGEGRTWIERLPVPLFVAFATAVAFSTYFCMYAFRKPFAAARFDGLTFFGTAVQLKTALVISQIIGYALSKYIGIKVCSEISSSKRALTLVLLIVWSEVALVIYGLVPGGWKVVPIFLNGLPLGMVWGLVVWYLEGRRTSELLLAGLSCSYILSSGVVKDVGRAMLEGTAASWWANVPVFGEWMSRALGSVSEDWMPAITGLHFLPLFLISVWLLSLLPRPNRADVDARSERQPMASADRMAFVRQFFLGLALLCLAYFFLTAYRDFRDNYQVELFDEMGYSYARNKGIITKTETIVMFGVMGSLALLNLIKSNRYGLAAMFLLIIFGLVLMGASTLLWKAKVINGFVWMTCTGLGSYLAYVPYGSVLFDRLMASTRAAGTAVFAIYLADAIGYTGSVGVQLFKDLGRSGTSRLGFFSDFTLFMSVAGGVCLVISSIYFLRRKETVEGSGNGNTSGAAGSVPANQKKQSTSESLELPIP
jgi:hypothetical protein